MADPNDIDPYRAPQSETVVPRSEPGAARPPLPWEPLESFKFAWEALKRHPMAILVAFIAGLIGSVLGMIAGAAQAILGASQDEQLQLIGWVVYGLGIVLNLPIAVWMAVGQSRYSLALARGNRPELGELFRAAGVLSAIGAQLLVMVALMAVMAVLCAPGGVLLVASEGESGAGLALLVVGGLVAIALSIFVGVRVTFAQLAAAEGVGGPFELLARSWRLSAGVFWLLIVFALLAFALAMVATIGGLLLLCIGVIATVPAATIMTHIATAHAYLRRSGEEPVLPAA